jgi:cell division protein FtsI/penicillin-binding protein 2
MKAWRINVILLFFVIWSGLIIKELINLQVLNHQYWLAFAQGQQKLFVSLEGERGKITFRDGTPLAINNKFFTVYISSKEIEEKERFINEVSSVLNIDKNFIAEKVESNLPYTIVKRKVDKEVIDKLANLKIKGLYFVKESGRYYPLDSVASQVVGFVGGDREGQYGIEGFYNDELKGGKSLIEREKYFGRYFSFDNEFRLKGSDIVLTLDYNIQTYAEKLLEKAKENLDIEKGEIIVVDPYSGEVLALANFPRFDLNNYSKVENISIFKNSAVQEIFEPGSVLKPVTMAAGLDQGKITPDTKYTDYGQVKIGGYEIKNYRNRTWGEQTMKEVLEKSINTGAIFVQKQLGKDLFLGYLDRFGFFSPTKIDLQGEVYSQNSELKKGYEVNLATASFGQGINVNSIQLVRAFCAIANGGKLIDPFVAKKIIKSNGEVIENKAFVEREYVISKETAKELSLMMVGVIDNSFSKRAKVEGYYLAGKTGTAQVAYENKKGYDPSKTIQSFIGFGPIFNPKFVILVKLYNPKSSTAEYSAAPIFREMAKYILDYFKVPPDY